MMKTIIRVIGVLFCMGGIVHWLIILGVMTERAPFIITAYFHSLALLGPLAGFGLVFYKNWGRRLGYFISVTQIPAHVCMLILDQFYHWSSGVGMLERGIDILFAIFYIVFFSRRNVKVLFV